jgi:hypothetical protein
MPLGAAIKSLILSHTELLRSKAMVGELRVDAGTWNRYIAAW